MVTQYIYQKNFTITIFFNFSGVGEIISIYKNPILNLFKTLF